MNWKPINKVLVGTIIGFVVAVAQRYIPAWHHGVPANLQTLIPYAAAMVTAWLVKLEKDLPNNL